MQSSESAHHFKHKLFYAKDVFIAHGIDITKSSNTPHSVGNFATFTLCHSGEATLRLNDGVRKLTPGAHIFIIPNTVVRLLDSTPDFDCSIISVSTAFRAENRLAISVPLINAMLYIKEQPVMMFTPQQQEMFLKIRESLTLAPHTTNEPYTRTLMLELVRAFFVWEQSTLAARITNIPTNNSPRDLITAKFLKLVNNNFCTQHMLNFYASELCITPKYLSSIVKSTTGRSASQWIDIFIVSEAQKQLSTTSLSIAEISDKLGFPNQSFFGKFFKRHVGKSPLAYRFNKD